MSEALEALKYFKSAYNDFLKTTNDMFCQITISREQANEFVEEVEVVEKKVKALEIIKEKECDMRWFKYCIKVNSEVETYNNGLPEYYEKLTQEEFNLLIEVLE